MATLTTSRKGYSIYDDINQGVQNAFGMYKNINDLRYGNQASDLRAELMNEQITKIREQNDREKRLEEALGSVSPDETSMQTTTENQIIPGTLYGGEEYGVPGTEDVTTTKEVTKPKSIYQMNSDYAKAMRKAGLHKEAMDFDKQALSDRKQAVTEKLAFLKPQIDVHTKDGNQEALDNLMKVFDEDEQLKGVLPKGFKLMADGSFEAPHELKAGESISTIDGGSFNQPGRYTIGWTTGKDGKKVAKTIKDAKKDVTFRELKIGENTIVGAWDDGHGNLTPATLNGQPIQGSRRKDGEGGDSSGLKDLNRELTAKTKIDTQVDKFLKAKYNPKMIYDNMSGEWKFAPGFNQEAYHQEREAMRQKLYAEHGLSFSQPPVQKTPWNIGPRGRDIGEAVARINSAKTLEEGKKVWEETKKAKNTELKGEKGWTTEELAYISKHINYDQWKTNKE